MNYKEIIEAKYNRESWQALLHDIFHNRVKFWATPTDIRVSSRLARKALSLGKISLADGETIAVYEVELSDKVNVERNRRGIRDMLTADWRSMGFAGAFIFSYGKGESVLRFSYVSETWGFNKDGEYEKVSTDTTRYTYLLGEGRGCRTAIDQFSKLKDSKQTLSDITAAFSVEVLTKLFYKDLYEWYLWAIDAKSNIFFPNNTVIEEDDREDIEKKIIRMITRIMFVWFIKQKKLVPDYLFDEEYLQTILKDFDSQSSFNGCYYNAILQNLFFATLNRPILDEDGNKRGFAEKPGPDIKTLYRYADLFSINKEKVVELFARVPFLNGGLFECLDKTKFIDGVQKAFNYDGFSRNDKTFSDGRYQYRATVPNALFFDPDRGLFSILNKYNFTIEENTPEEQQVALDPELLGKVFENLLGVYNPETQKTARNQSGSFYTPREIVNYMVDESLIAYLGDSHLHRAIFASDFEYDVSQKESYEKIATKLKAVKVLDPACGSGAYPMGLLNRLIEVLQRITPNENIYNQKLEIIENCLYGSDIQSIAIQITKLRFFISLICDCERDDSKPNFGIPTLPNLETKFVAANSLIAKKKLVMRGLFEDPEIEPTKEALAKIRRDHFLAKKPSVKRHLRKEDLRLREKLVQLLAKDHNFSPDDVEQLVSWNPYDQNTVSKFFDPEWMFGLSEHPFDIVIGNPPYIQLQSESGKLAKLYTNCGYETFTSTGDIYCLFYERGYQLLKEGGHLCYITSNKWMRAGYGERTRAFFANRTNPKLLIDFAGVKIFESATVDTNILLFSKSNNEHKTLCAVTDKQNKIGVKNLSVFVQQQGALCDFTGGDSWVIFSPIEQSIKRKIEAAGVPLKEWNIKINYGIKTGLNDAFVVSTTKRDEILANCSSEDERERTAEIIRPILRGKDIKRYGFKWANLWVINTHNGIKGKLHRIDVNELPSIKAHLDQYWAEISKRADKGDTPYNLRNCAYLEDFSLPRIVYREIGTEMEACLVEPGWMINNKLYMISGDHLRHLLNFFNSKLFNRILLPSANLTGGKGVDFIEKIPAPLPKDCDLSEVDEYSTPNLLYKWYKLTTDEIDFIENASI